MKGRKMAIIAISGYPGAGKSTLAEKLARELDYENINIGAIFKKLAERDNCDITQFYKNLKHKIDIEKMIDQEQEELMLTKNNKIIQGRMAPFLKSSFKKINILLKVEDKEGARRQMNRPENQKKLLMKF
ncbi:MAG: AAA family ATPase [Candidatus Brennerbacteria bacterium]|nr:AAA family ATPase [Candidatus Brennerbacteria bacterium]